MSQMEWGHQRDLLTGIKYFGVNILCLEHDVKPVSSLLPLRGRWGEGVTLWMIHKLPRRNVPFHWRDLAIAPLTRRASPREGS